MKKRRQVFGLKMHNLEGLLIAGGQLNGQYSRPVAMGAWGGKCHPWATGCRFFATPGKFLHFFIVALHL